MGNPGILLKPNIHPLVGDSSTRKNVGNWFKISSLARSFLPHVSICNYTFLSTSEHYVEVAIVNPVDEPIAVKLVSNNAMLRGVQNARKLLLPTTEFLIDGYDEFADHDELLVDEDSSIDYSNDPAAVVSRERNKVKLKLNVADRPDSETSDADSFIVLGFLLSVAPAPVGSEKQDEEDVIGTFAVKLEVKVK